MRDPVDVGLEPTLAARAKRGTRRSRRQPMQGLFLYRHVTHHSDLTKGFSAQSTVLAYPFQLAPKTASRS